MEILSADRMRDAEEAAIKDLGINSLVLMERAALAVFEECGELFHAGSQVLVLAGRGNNGGDGLAVARLFHGAGCDVTVIMADGNSKLSRQTIAQRQILRKLGVKITELNNRRTIPDIQGYDLIIDAIFGIGLNRPVQGLTEQLIQAVNLTGGHKVSVDVPSGLSAEQPAVLGETFVADLTVTFTRSKPAHHLYPARAFCGEVVVRDIGIPDELITSELFLLTEENIPTAPVRTPYGYKNEYGHVAVVGGSLGKSGAVIMAAGAALRAGAGLVSCVLPADLAGAVMSRPELMSMFSESGSMFAEADADRLAARISPVMTVALGPGLGRNPENMAFVRRFIKACPNNMIIDADALYALDQETMKALKGRAVLTPHVGEFAHMCGVDKAGLNQNRLKLAREYAINRGVWLVLKSAETVISFPDGVQYISEWGTPSLSKGGSGDILTGICAALVAQGYNSGDAALLACKMQGDASAIASRFREPYSVTPDDIIHSIGLKDDFPY